MTTLRELAKKIAIPLVALMAILAFSASSAAAVTAKPAWSITSFAGPTVFPPGNPAGCPEQTGECNLYTLLIKNVGSEPTSGTVEVADTLPAGVTPVRLKGLGGLACPELTNPFKCTLEEPLAPGATIGVEAFVTITEGSIGPLMNSATVSGGGEGVPAVSTSSQNAIGAQQPPFGIFGFGLEALNLEGVSDTQAGAHPNSLTTNLYFPTIREAGGTQIGSVEQVKDIVVDLPPGFVGDPQATPRCPVGALVGKNGEFASACPVDSQVGTVVLQLFNVTKVHESRGFPVFNLTPENGYPAEFGFNIQGNPVLLYATVNPATHYGVRVTVPGIIRHLAPFGSSLTFWGTPADPSHDPLRQVRESEFEAGAKSSSAPAAFITNPTYCQAAPAAASVHADSWQNPGVFVSGGTNLYPQLTGCESLQFQPTIGVTPDTTQADEPSGYEVDLKVPQATNLFPDRATPHLKDATVTLPAGVAISPSAADGLLACQPTGPQGINIGTSEVGPEGHDLGNPEATELGAGHAGGNASPYDDGLYHAAPGHCPAASTVGTIEVETPLLPPHTLKGHVFVAQPACGAPGQPECTEAAAETGGVFGLYLDVQGAGVIIKLPGKVEVGGNGQHSRETGLAPGQIRTTFAEDPQQPFSELRLKLNGGLRAPLANPQTCGAFTTTSVLRPWSWPATPDATPSSSPFSVDWDNAGGVCPGALPFAPGFSAGTVNPQAGAYSPFTLTFSRHDREQDLAGITVHMPPGLLGKIAGIPQCPNAQANTGGCPAASRIGSVTAAAGAGSHPLWQSGTAYLTEPYKGAPFGLAFVVPAVAGPYNLGNIVVRAAIYVDPHTAALTVVSDPLPQSVDGVPLRVQTINVTTDRPGFTFNPTSCAQQAVGATIAGVQGAAVNVASPFAAAGCRNLPFKPVFTVLTLAKTSKANGASLDVKVAQQAGEANIHKVNVQLPLALPSRLTTLQKACTQAQFEANPAGCPEGSFVGTAIAHTPVLSNPLTGPAILVSHGGAAFPDLVIVLQGEGIRIDLTGNTLIKKGITFSRFETVPDAPISSFELKLPEGPHSALGANGSLCSQKLVMPTTIVGQNGAQVTQSTNIAVTGCGKPSIRITKVKIKGNTVLVTVVTTQQGTVTVSGNGLKTIKKTQAAGAHQLKVSLTKNGRTARKHHKKTKVKASVKNSNGSSSKTKTLKL
jgi:uncharacterized repeat protein (TIGR01451 family)